MILQVYADESGTNDPTGKEPGSQVPVVCGFIESPEYWAEFCLEWKAILDRYGAPYFHFREFASKLLRDRENSPYHGWSEEKRDDFLYDLAILSSDSAVPIGGFYHARKHHEIGNDGNPFKFVFQTFFNDFCVAMNAHWPNFDGKVLFVFDTNEDTQKWVAPLREVHESFKQSDRRFGGLTFEDDKDSKHLPLQAADLYAYASRQQAQRYMESGKQDVPMRVLDFILNKNLYASRRTGNPFWKLTVDLVRADQKKQKADWAAKGMPRKQYFPEIHFPFEQYR